MNNKISKEQFNQLNSIMSDNAKVDLTYLYDVYSKSFDIVESLLTSQNKLDYKIDSQEIVSFAMGEYLYSTSSFSEEKLQLFLQNKNIQSSMANVVADKYISLSLYKHTQIKLTNSYLPPISTLSLYVNLMLNFVTTFQRTDNKSNLIVDLLTKSLSIAKSVIGLLCEGYETEAFAVWRTLHECECTLILMDKYKDPAINGYLRHMRYGLAYRDSLMDKQEQENLLQQVKNEMAIYELKSKDTKKYIEYGWLHSIEESKNIEGFKLNFRDGLERLAGLHDYADTYMMSSEILHSTPLLIYSNKQYFFLITLLNLYESFFRIEGVFQTLFFSVVGEKGKESYIEMRKLYYSQLINIHDREKINFDHLVNKNQQKKMA